MVLIYLLRSFAKVWDYIDLDKVENEIKENNEPDIPSIAIAPVAALAVPTAPAGPAVAPVTALAATLSSTRIATPRLLSQQG
jgi:hypothetical protein